MVITEDALARLAAKNVKLEAADDELKAELADTRNSVVRESAVGFVEETVTEADTESAFDSHGGSETDFTTETIVYAKGRPVITVFRDAAVLKFTDPESEVWRARLAGASDALAAAARAVGRVEVEGHEQTWLGTGWLLDHDIVVTNRHVAREFGRADGAQFIFRQGFFGPITAAVDFLEEVDRLEDLTFAVSEILHIEDDAGPDVAFLRVNQTGAGIASPIRLAPKAKVDDFVAVIGYPARDSRIPDQALMETLFGNLYDKKRLAPGQVTAVDNSVILHDATTLGGNSGSAVVSLQTGEAVGLHFAGRFLKSNYGVSAEVLKQRLDATKGRGRPTRQVLPDNVDGVGRDSAVSGGHDGAFNPNSVSTVSTPRLTAVVPLRITLEIANPLVEDGSSVTAAAPVATAAAGVAGQDVVIEAVASDYRDRKGFDEKFLGADNTIPLPTVDDEGDVLTFDDNGRPGSVLRYEHFSVVMSASRRLCWFSAVNIDGKKRAGMDRTGWRSDPRLPPGAQIRYECYGDAPKYSRGHMTRREDPVWGSPEVAKRGNDDSMHVTNAVPQMQTFNAGIWLDLENYALQNARQDEMKISVITGPFLSEDDPVQYGVKIPVDFWKVIVFIHDSTGELTATGYSLSQRKHIPEEEFVFGQFKTTQRRIEWIERTAGLSFNGLAAMDPFREPEGVGSGSELTSVREIQFQ